MESIRFVLIVCFAMVSMKLWTSWEDSYTNKEPVQIQQTSESTIKNSGPTEVPEIDTGPRSEEAPTKNQAIENQQNSDPVSIVTDVFQLKIDRRGGVISRAALNDFPTSIDKPADPYVLMDNSPELVQLAQGGLLSKQPAPTHESIYQTSEQNYILKPEEDTLLVPFTWTQDGISVTKTFEFERGSHLVKISYRISNNTKMNWVGRAYTQLKRNAPSTKGMRVMNTYTGAVLSGPDNRYEKISFKEITSQPLARDAADAWIAMIQHYFLVALIPADKTGTYHYYTRDLGNNLFAAGALTPQVEILPGEIHEVIEQLYVGPKDQKKLEKIASGLDLTVDYGKLWFLAKPLFWGLSSVHEVTNNWGWSIILITVFLKILFYKLSAAGYKSMANMRRVQPRLVALRDRYKDDKVKMNQAMMQIYKEEKINPLGGCFPIMIQIPVFMALYWVLLESIELRQADFIFWLHDLSAPDQFRVLPVLMGITMFIQQKLNPAPIDPIQAKVMMIMPFAFTIFFSFFPSGLVLYWVVNNTLSIVQQWIITQNLEKAGLSSRPR